MQNLLEFSRLESAEERVTKLYDWAFERTKLLFQAVLAFLGAFVVAFFVALARGDLASLPAMLVAIGGVLGVTFPSIAASLVYRRLSSFDEEYLTACRILAVLKTYGR